MNAPAPALAIAGAPPSTSPADVATKFNAILAELGARYFERADVLYAMALAVMSKQHLFMYGLPGTAKSAITRALCERLVDAVYFEVSMSKDLPAEAVLGPWDIPALRDRGEMIRRYEGFLPTANIAMTDEVGKMSGTLGHNMLQLLNERRVHMVDSTTGKSYVECPLYTAIGGSNELPTEENESMQALWDRYLLRVVVNPIRENSNFVALLQQAAKPAGTPTTLDWPSLAYAIDNVVPAIRLPNDVAEAIAKLRGDIEAADMIVGDRRWRQGVDVARAAAFLAGRDVIEMEDLGALRFVLWDQPTQIRVVERMTMSISNPFAEKALDLREQVEEQMRAAQSAKGLMKQERTDAGIEISGKLKVIQAEADKLKQDAIKQGANITAIDDVIGLASTTRQMVFDSVLGV